MKALKIIAAALGRSLGSVQVVVDASAPTAMTDGKKIILPVLPDVGTEEQERVLMGLVAHESFHIRYTYRRIKGKPDGTPPEGVTATRFIAHLANALEDPRIENLGMQRYPGTRKMLGNLVRFCKDHKWFPDAPENDEKLGNLVIFGLLFRHRAGLLGQDLAKASANWQQAAENALGAELWEQITALADASVLAVNKFVADGPWWAAQKISDLLGDRIDQEDPELKSPDMGDLPGTAIPSSGDADYLMDRLPVTQRLSGGTFLLEAKRIYREIGSPLEAKLWARAQEEIWAARTGTAGVVTTSLARMNTTGKIFARRLDGDSRSLAVKILIDKSGSMSSQHHMDHANAGALALTMVLSRLGIPWSVSWFAMNYHEGRAFSPAPVKNSEPWNLYPNGGTFFSAALSRSVEELLAVQADRKIVICLTDGSCDRDKTAVIDGEATRQGIDIRYVLVGAVTGFDFAESRAGYGEGADVGKSIIQAFQSFV